MDKDDKFETYLRTVGRSTQAKETDAWVQQVKKKMNKINILIIGSGGREHAIAMALNNARSSDVLFAFPGNPGILEIATFYRPYVRE